MSRIELETIVAAPAERCFDLSLSVDLHLHAAAHTRERAVAGVTSGLLALGDEVTWQARHLGRDRRLAVVISADDRPRHFRDEQVDGPFRRFVHDHSSRRRRPAPGCATSWSSRRAPASSTGSCSCRT